MQYAEQMNKAHQDCPEVEHGHPIGTKDVETHVAFEINVGVVHQCLALDFGRVVGVGGRDSDLEFERRTSIEPVGGRHVGDEEHEIVGVRKVDFAACDVADFAHICDDSVFFVQMCPSVYLWGGGCLSGPAARRPWSFLSCGPC